MKFENIFMIKKEINKDDFLREVLVKLGTSNETPTVLQQAGMETNDIITVIKTKSSTETEYVEYTISSYNDIVEALDAKKPTEAGQIQNIQITFEDVSENNDNKKKGKKSKSKGKPKVEKVFAGGSKPNGDKKN